MKQTRKTALRVVCFFLILSIAIVGIGKLLQRKQAYARTAEFFSEKEEFDVLFFGTSHMINGILPMELWRAEGITSYNMGGYGCSIPASYWILKNSLDYHTPDVVVIDTWAANVDNKASVTEDDTQLHMIFDAFPLTKDKEAAIQDMFGTDKLLKLEYFFNLVVFHHRWDELTLDDFKPSVNIEKGAEEQVGMVPASVSLIDSSESNDSDSIAKQYLRKMIELCQSKDIDVVLVYLPFPAVEDEQASANSIGAIAEEYGVPYLNMMYDDLVNYATDCYDGASHLNLSGALKATDYLGEYLASHYDLTSDYTEQTMADWYEDYKRYETRRGEQIENEENLDSLLLLLTDPQYSFDISMNAGTAYLQDAEFLSLLANLGVSDVNSCLSEDLDCDVKIVVHCSDNVDYEVEKCFTYEKD